jgi:hypothetical protein
VDAARFFWPCTEIIYNCLNDDLYKIDLIKAEKKPKIAEYKFSKNLTPWSEKMLTHLIPEGNRNNVFHRLAKDLRKAEYSEEEAFELLMESETIRSRGFYNNQFPKEELRGIVTRTYKICWRSGIEYTIDAR